MCVQGVALFEFTLARFKASQNGLFSLESSYHRHVLGKLNLHFVSMVRSFKDTELPVLSGLAVG